MSAAHNRCRAEIQLACTHVCYTTMVAPPVLVAFASPADNLVEYSQIVQSVHSVRSLEGESHATDNRRHRSPQQIRRVGGDNVDSNQNIHL